MADVSFKQADLKAARDALKQYFGYDSFRPGQAEVISAILSGRDSLSIMPTGAGKSVCYQLPAILLDGITLVISPLISLMQDQVKALNSNGIKAAYINSSLSERQIGLAMDNASRGMYKIIYVAPERLMTKCFFDLAERVKISMITVDEAHCISQWGQDFRPSYMNILPFAESLAYRPRISAFTATATEEVTQDIAVSLDLKAPFTINTGFDRPNLSFSVVHSDSKRDYVLNYIAEHPQDSGIIYCGTRKNADMLGQLLCSRGISCGVYHAGLDPQTRKRNQDDFIYDRVKIIAATNAFGMGIDKSNVRYVIHYNMPQSMENYYQEAGRAGRDGEPSDCILLFSQQDVFLNRFLLDNKETEGMDPDTIECVRARDAQRLSRMEGYCSSDSCLRNYILSYFGEHRTDTCGICGNCVAECVETEMTEQAQRVIRCVAELNGRYGAAKLADILSGSNNAKMKEISADRFKSYGSLKGLGTAQIVELVTQLIQGSYLKRGNDKYMQIFLGSRFGELLKKDAVFYLRSPREAVRQEKPVETKGLQDALTSLGFELIAKLKDVRMDLAREEHIPPYIIFNDRTLAEMAVYLPRNRYEMLSISGVSENKYLKYGNEFLKCISDFTDLHSGEAISMPELLNTPGKALKDIFSKKKEAPAAAGKPWTAEEDSTLKNEYSQGMKIGAIARRHERSTGAIRKRLQKLELL